MLPVFLSDLRGFLLLLVVVSVAHICGLPCLPLLLCLCVVCTAGLAFSLAFYVHTTRTVFNRRVNWSMKAYYRHLMMTRPLEALWRFLTVPLRASPDFQILGEVRTGTTTLAAHLRGIGCLGPFSPWIFPLASDKESFYFAGHYFGIVHPSLYRMCYPLKPTLWFRRYVLRRPTICFDACASHFNTPWTAALMHEAAPHAALVVQLREPSEQHKSWWSLEMGAHGLAVDMGMSKDFIPSDYPPRSFGEAIKLSQSAKTAALYKEGEFAAKKYLAANGLFARLRAARLPERLLPFPGGQLASFAHMGRYADNLQRFADIFGMDRIAVVDLKELTQPTGAGLATNRLAALVPEVGILQRQAEADAVLAGRLVNDARVSPHLNEGPKLPMELMPSSEQLAELKDHYRADNQRLFDLIGRDLGWNTTAK